MLNKNYAKNRLIIPTIRDFIEKNCNEKTVHFLKICYRFCAVTLNNIIRGVRYYLFYRGDKYCCPCCGKKSKHFLSNTPQYEFNANINTRKYKDVICPYCISSPRHRIECDFIDKADMNLKEKNILIFAPEYCIIMYFKHKRLSYTTADLYGSSVDLQIDIQDIPLPNDSQELIICNHVLEHVPNDIKAISELSRILSPSGMALVTVPADLDRIVTYEDASIIEPAERELHFGQHDHLRLYGKDFENRLRTAFNVEVLDISMFDDKILPVHGPANIDMNILYVCRKKEGVHLYD